MYWKFFKYSIRHKWFVLIECYKQKIIWRGIIHDWSKFRLSEFIPYARYFYGDYPKYKTGAKTCWPHLFKEDIDRRFDKAWLFHIHRNRHHWQYFLLREDDGDVKNIPIPVIYLKEMLADWRGAGKAITGKDNVVEWYTKNANKISLHWISKMWIEQKLGLARPPYDGCGE